MKTYNQSLIDTSRELLQQFRTSGFSGGSHNFGITIQEDKLIVPLFGRPYRVSVDGVKDNSGNEINPAVSMLLLSYVLNRPESHPLEGGWVTYYPEFWW